MTAFFFNLNSLDKRVETTTILEAYQFYLGLEIEIATCTRFSYLDELRNEAQYFGTYRHTGKFNVVQTNKYKNIKIGWQPNNA